jgi:hypothetical protein
MSIRLFASGFAHQRLYESGRATGDPHAEKRDATTRHTVAVGWRLYCPTDGDPFAGQNRDTCGVVATDIASIFTYFS